MNHNNSRVRGGRLAVSLVAIAVLGACSSLGTSVPPLDPIIGDTGRPLSENAAAFDVRSYSLDLEVLPKEKRIRGTGSASVRALAPISHVELKLDSRFAINGVTANGAATTFTRDGGVISIKLPKPLQSGEYTSVSIAYEGAPHVAKRAPWEGGFVWSKTERGDDWIATAVQGEGCDLWWPCKDHFGDKADRMDIRITVPARLSVAMNGVLQGVDQLPDGRRAFRWLLSVPASDYNISLNVGPFVRIQEQYTAVNGASVPIEFWALPQHERKARNLINDDLRHQVVFYEKFLGPYPWGNEKLGVVETPHLGMEHQTINAYGKGYKRDDNGFDWLLQHELAHEWFGNLLTHEKLNDAWLHEGYGLYMQPAYARYRYGDAAYHAFLYKSYLGLKNCAPIVLDGTPTSNEAFNPDIYGKGGWTLHTLRWLIGDEAFWRATRVLLYGTPDTANLPYPIAPRYRNTGEFIAIVNQEAGRDLGWMFDVYLREAALPELVTERRDDRLLLQWKTPGNKPFPMPVPVSVNGQRQTVEMKDGKAELMLGKRDHLIIDPEMMVLRQLPILGDCKEVTEKDKAAKK